MEIDTPAAEIQPDTRDFASRALETITVDPEKTQSEATVVKEKAAVKAESPKSSIPDNLFDSPSDKTEAPTKKEELTKSEFDDIAKPDIKNPKASQQWDQLKAKGADFEKRYTESSKTISDLQTKIAELEGKTKQGDELAGKYSEMEKRHAEAMELVNKVNIELNPEFRKTYIDGRKNLIGQARTIVEESGGNPDDIQTALNLTGKSRVDALSLIAEGMSSFQQGRLGRIIDSLSSLDDEAASKRSSPESYLSQMQERAQQSALREAEERAKHASMAYDDAFSGAAKDIEVLRRVDGLPEWNKQGEEIASRAKDLWNNNRDMSVAARKFIEAEAMPVYRKLFMDQRAEAKALRAELDEAKEKLAGIYSNRPAVRGGKTTSSAGSKPMDFADRTNGMINGSISV